LMVTYSAQGLLITASKHQDAFEYDASVAVFLTELLKLLIALLLLPPQSRLASLRGASFAFVIPAALYTLQNRLIFESLKYLTPPEYQVLNTSKLFTTSIVYRVGMCRQLNLLQWFALLLLGLGMIIASGSELDEGFSSAGRCVWCGALIMFVIAWLSAIAGVTNEYLIKQAKDVLEANVSLYLAGVITCALQVGGGEAGFSSLTSLQGFTLTTWLIVGCNAVLGQTIAFLYRYTDSITKIYASFAATMFTTVLSSTVFRTGLGFELIMGYFVAMISVCLYYLPHHMLLAADTQVIERICCGHACRQDTN